MSQRAQKLASDLKQRIGTMLVQDYQSFCSDLLITVSRVELSQDLRTAHIYISIYGHDSEQKLAECFHFLLEEKKKIRQQIGKGMIIRHIPDLRFHLDESLEYVEKIERILHTLRERNH
jgi:ribosome-binding factor A